MSERDDVPLLDLRAQHESLDGAVERAVLRVVRSGQYILGEEVAAFEREVAEHLQAEHAIGVSSGTDALLAALMCLDVGPGDEVVTTPFSFFATAGCVARVGARPIFVDIRPDTFNLDVTQLEGALTQRTKAIVPVHLFGQLAEMDPLRAIAAAREVPIVEDAAQALGARCDAHRVGQGTALACFSFFPSKNLGALGDGGLVTTDDAELAERMRIIRAHGSRPKYYHHVVGGNFRLDAIQAAALRAKLPHLEAWSQTRRDNAARYDRWFADAGLAPERLTTPARLCDGHVYNQYVIRTDRRDGLQEHLRARGIASAIYYPLALHRQPCFANLGLAEGTFPEAERAASEVLALPVFAELGEARQRRVADAVIDYLSAG